jgi:hypothetical protein
VVQVRRKAACIVVLNHPTGDWSFAVLAYDREFKLFLPILADSGFRTEAAAAEELSRYLGMAADVMVAFPDKTVDAVDSTPTTGSSDVTTGNLGEGDSAYAHVNAGRRGEAASTGTKSIRWSNGLSDTFALERK